MIYYDLRGKGAPHHIVGKSFCYRLFNPTDVYDPAVIKGGAEGDDEDLLIALFVAVQRVVHCRVPGVPSKIIGISELSLHKGLLRIGKRIPGCFGGFTVSLGRICLFLDIDSIDKLCNLVGGFLVSSSCVFLCPGFLAGCCIYSVFR